MFTFIFLLKFTLHYPRSLVPRFPQKFYNSFSLCCVCFSDFACFVVVQFKSILYWSLISYHILHMIIFYIHTYQCRHSNRDPTTIFSRQTRNIQTIKQTNKQQHKQRTYNMFILLIHFIFTIPTLFPLCVFVFHLLCWCLCCNLISFSISLRYIDDILWISL